MVYASARSNSSRVRLVGPTVLLVFFALHAAGVSAHEFKITRVTAVFSPDGQYQVDLRMDVDALALGVSPTVDSIEVASALQAMSPEEFEAAVQRAKTTIERRTRIRFDGAKQHPAVSFPEYDPDVSPETTVPTVLGITARLEGAIPEGAREFTIGLSRSFQAVHLTIVDDATGASSVQIMEAGADSLPYSLARPMPTTGAWTVIRQYIGLGFTHILPKGLDHILFVLGLFLLSPRMRPLLWQVTAFTVAHSVTLALAMGGVFSLPPRIVEPLIAVSIAYVAVENMCTSELKPWRPVVVFAFGLLHGLGFAGVLRELGLPSGQFLAGLLSFNIGVELGQITVVMGAFLSIGFWRSRPWYRRRIIIPFSLLITFVSLYWVVQRTFLT